MCVCVCVFIFLCLFPIYLSYPSSLSIYFCICNITINYCSLTIFFFLNFNAYLL